MTDEVIDVPVTPAEPVVEAEPKPETPPATGAESPGVDETPPAVKREITIERNRRREAEARATQAERERQQALEAVAKLTAQQPQEPTVKAPTRDQFESEEAYTDAYIDWKADQKVEAKLAAQREADAKAKAEQEQARIRTQYTENVTAARAKYEDFADVAENPQLHISRPMAEAIITSPSGADVQYWLGKHPDEAKRIADLPAIAAVREIGRIEAAIASQAAAPRTPAAAPLPKPVVPVGASNTVAKDIYDPNLPYKEFVALREKELGRRR